jgi:hypothetical protein
MSKTHGTRYAYIAGCRCDECRSANTTYMARYRRDKPKPTFWRNNRRWEPWEDELALDYSKSAWQIADTLQRTPAAISNHRRVLIARRINKKEEQ